MPGRFTPAAVRQHASAGTLEPLYLVTGNDEVAMSDLAGAIADTVEEDFRAFNVQRFYGSDNGTKLAAVLDAASTLPLLSPRRVVILLQAERVLASRKKAAAADEGETAEEADGEGGSGKGQLALLKEYAKHPHDHATVVVAGAGLGRSFEPLAKQAAYVVCEASYDVVTELSRQHGVRFDRGAVELLKRRAMSGEVIDSARLRDEAERVLLYASGRQVVTREMVEEVVGRPSAAGGWTLSNCIAARDAAGALRELDLLLADGAVPVMLLGMLRSTIERKVASQDLPRALDALMRTDLSLKTSGGDPRVLLERLIVEVCATARER